MRNAGFLLSLVTNGGSGLQRAKIEKFGLSHRFDSIFIKGKQGIGKPDTRIYRRDLGSLNVQAEDGWMVGDNLEWDVASPQFIGVTGVWIDRDG